MKVKVKKGHGGEWYGKVINKIYEVTDTTSSHYIVKIEDNAEITLLHGRRKALIYKSDAEIIF